MKNNTCYEPFDGCYGTVNCRCGDGVFLTLDNGQEAYASRFGNLVPGTEVLCTVLKVHDDERKPLVSIDAVVAYASYAA